MEYSFNLKKKKISFKKKKKNYFVYFFDTFYFVTKKENEKKNSFIFSGNLKLCKIFDKKKLIKKFIFFK